MFIPTNFFCFMFWIDSLFVSKLVFIDGKYKRGNNFSIYGYELYEGDENKKETRHVLSLPNTPAFLFSFFFDKIFIA